MNTRTRFVCGLIFVVAGFVLLGSLAASLLSGNRIFGAATLTLAALAVTVVGAMVLLGYIPESMKISAHEFAVKFAKGAIEAPPEARILLEEALDYLDQVSPTAATHARSAILREQRLNDRLLPAMKELGLTRGPIDQTIAGHRPDSILRAQDGQVVLVDEWTSPTENYLATRKRCLKVVDTSRRRAYPLTRGMLLVGNRPRPEAGFDDDDEGGFWYLQLPTDETEINQALSESLSTIVPRVSHP